MSFSGECLSKLDFIRKEIFSKSFFPKTIREWNNLSLELKESDSINIFKEKLKRLYGPNKSIKLYSHGHGWHTVNHCRLRLGLSHLKHHLFRYNIIQSAHCENVTCDNLPETSSHFLLYCPRYEPQRRSMLKEISKIIFPGTSYITVIALMSDHLCNIILHGSEDLSLEENKKVFADLFLFCYERDFMMSLSDDKQADVIDAFNTTSRYLDDILNINNVYFENMVSQIYPSELQLNKANASDTEAAFLDLHLSISNGIVSTKIYDKRDDFDFDIVNFPFLDGDVPRSTSYGVYISQLIRFARASSYVTDFNTRNKLLTQGLLKQGYRYHKLRKTFSKFYRPYFDLISKFQVGLKCLLRRGLSEPDFYGDLVYKLKKIVGSNNFSAQFIKIISHYKKIGYNINVLQQTACLVVNPITVGNFAFLFNCTPVGRTSDSMMVPT